MSGRNDTLNRSSYNTQEYDVASNVRMIRSEICTNPYQRSINSNTSTNTTTGSLENLIQQLECSRVTSEARDVVSNLKNLLQLSCSETWNISQVCRYSEWTLDLIEMYKCHSYGSNNRNRSNTIKRSNIEERDNEYDNIRATCMYAILSLYQLMESHWDDVHIYTSIMSRKDNDCVSSKGIVTLLDSLVDVICVLDTDLVDTTQCKTYGLLHASVSALALSWGVLDRLHSLSVSKYDCVSFRSRSIFDAPWWIQQKWTNESTSNIHENSPIQIVCHIALRGVSIDQEEWQRQQMSSISSNSGLQLCEYKTNCINLLVQVLEYAGETNEWTTSHNNNNRFLMTRAEWVGVLRQLVQEALRLNDTNMPVSSFAVWSLSAFHLVVTLNSLTVEPHWVSSSFDADDDTNIEQFSISDEYRRILQSSDVVDHIIRATYWTSGINLADDSPRPKPRWTQQADTQIVQRSFIVLKELYRTSPVVVGNNLAHHPMVKHFLYTQIRSLFSNSKYATSGSCSNKTDKVSHFIWLHDTCRNLTRDVFKDILQKQQQSLPTSTSVLSDIFISLIETRNIPSQSLSAVIFVRTMLEDGSVSLRHDALSREVWDSIDVRFVTRCVEEMSTLLSFIVQNRKSAVSEYNKALLLTMIDLLIILLSNEENGNEEASKSIDFIDMIIELLQTKQSIEDLLNYVASPVSENIDVSLVDTTMNANNLSLDSNGETPPVNNLSRIENRSVIDDSPERAQTNGVLNGFDPTLRLAIATLLALLGTVRSKHRVKPEDAMESYKRFSLIRGRMLSASNGFIASYEVLYSSSVGLQATSFDITRRRVKLLTILATGENEDTLSRMVHSFEHYQSKNFAYQSKQIQELKEELHLSRQREQNLQTDNVSYQNLLSKVQLRFQKDKCEWQRSVAQNSKKLVDVHLAERSKAERRAQELSHISADAERQLADADRAVQQYRESDTELRAQLEQTTKKVQDLLSREENMVQRNQVLESDLVNLKEAHIKSETAIKHVETREKQMREKYVQQKESLVCLGQSEDELKSSLENLFADMCSLAYLYEIKESEISKYQESGDMVVDRLKRKLEIERQRYVELDEQQKRIQYENDMLSKKYAKARDKLEEERDDRRKENERRKRATPVSYINHLHSNNQSYSGGDKRDESQALSSNKSKPPPVRYTSFPTGAADTGSRTDKENSGTNRTSSRIGSSCSKDRDHVSNHTSQSRQTSSSTTSASNSRSYR